MSPVVVGVALVLVYNSRTGLFGQGLSEAWIQVIFDAPGMIMATVFVALPLVIREAVPVLQEIGDEQEQAARSLGANATQTFLRTTMPSIGAVVCGVGLSLARSLGEFSAVKVVSWNVMGKTQNGHAGRRAEVPELRADAGVLDGVHAGVRLGSLHRDRQHSAAERRQETAMSIESRGSARSAATSSRWRKYL